MKKNYDASTAFLDLLFNTLLGFVALFALAFIQMSTEKNNKNLEVKSEFLIIISWPKDIDNDVDVYVSDPLNNLVFFRSRDVGLMNLDRDDTGVATDTIGNVVADDNREIVSLRNTIAGEYIVNVHMFHVNTQKATPVTIQIDKINPYGNVITKTVVLEKHFDEKTAVRFTIDDKNKVIDINDLKISLIDKHLQGVPGGEVH
jgi:hypothetical protein